MKKVHQGQQAEAVLRAAAGIPRPLTPLEMIIGGPGLEHRFAVSIPRPVTPRDVLAGGPVGSKFRLTGGR